MVSPRAHDSMGSGARAMTILAFVAYFVFIFSLVDTYGSYDYS